MRSSRLVGKMFLFVWQTTFAVGFMLVMLEDFVERVRVCVCGLSYCLFWFFFPILFNPASLSRSEIIMLWCVVVVCVMAKVGTVVNIYIITLPILFFLAYTFPLLHPS